MTLVTGASGFVGNNLVRHLLQQGRRVRALVREPENESMNGLKVESVVCDIVDPASLCEAFVGVSSVFHVAGAISINGEQDSLMRQVNVDGTANVVDACLQAGVGRMVHFSSIHALSNEPNDQPINESRQLALESGKHLPYDRSKAAGELEVLTGIENGLDAVILNPVGIFGPHDYGPSPTGEFLQQLTHRQLPGLVQAGYFWVDVRDVARAAVSAEKVGRRGEKYILAGEYASFGEIAKWVQEINGARPPLISVPLWIARAVAPTVCWYSRWRKIRPLVTPEAIQIVNSHQQIETDKAAIELGFTPRPLCETIADTVRWLHQRESKEN